MSSNNARFIWSDPTGRGRNRYCHFRKTFELSRIPAEAEFCIFADTRYRLSVNGQALAHGPARFHVGRPLYDTHELSPLLRVGRNVMAVTVNSFGCSTFIADESIGGLVAWGTIRDGQREIGLQTDQSWRAIDSRAYEPDVAKLSFALNPGETFDARKIDAGWDSPDFDDTAWPAAVVLESQNHWGPPQPRSIPPLNESPIPPTARLGAWRVTDALDEEVHSCAVWRHKLKHGPLATIVTWIHSPRKQEVILGAWWGRYLINGQEVRADKQTGLPLRHNLHATLEEGWNFFQVIERVHQDVWELYLGLPRSAGLKLSADREIDSPTLFRYVGLPEATPGAATSTITPIRSPQELPMELGPWRDWPRGTSANSAFHERAWKKLTPVELQGDAAVSSATLGAGGFAVLYDLGTEILGRPKLRFKAAEGAIVDMALTDYLTEGKCDNYRHHFVRFADRYIARAGEQTWHHFHPKGSRFLELYIHGNTQGFKLLDLTITQAHYPVQNIGSFECSDPRLERIWSLGRDTQRACMEDVYLDTPRRERGLYTGDMLVQFYTNLACFGDTKLFRRCLELLFDTQHENGLLSGISHGLPSGRHPDYSCIAVQSVWHYYTRSGDTEFLRQIAPRLKKLIEGLNARESGNSRLIDGSGLHPYIDVARVDREGVSCALNCFYQRALHDAAEALAVIGDAAAETYRQRAAEVADAIRSSFWDQSRRVFVDRRRNEVTETGPSAHANTLPVLYGIASHEQTGPAVQYVLEAMRTNFDADRRRMNFNAYFSFYVLEMLYDRGHVAEAEAFMKTGWGRMLDAGAWTCWEFFNADASLCHAWATCPTHYLSTRVLGVQFPDLHDLNTIAIRPHPGSLSWAEGTYPHPRGPIHVRWELKDGQPQVSSVLPPGVTVVA